MIRIIGIGAGGSAKIILNILRDYQNECEVVGLVDDDKRKTGSIFEGIPIIGITESLIELDVMFDAVIICVGATRNTVARKRIYDFLKVNNLKVASAISKNSIISPNVNIGEGCIIMPGVVINAGAVVGENVYINSGTIIEHDCYIGNSCFLATGCILSGCVKIQEGTFMGSGSVAIGKTKIGKNVTIGAGSVIIRDIPDNVVAYGNPAHKFIKEKLNE